MSRGKYLSLKEARQLKQLSRFAKEHPSEGDAEKFDRLFRAMASGTPATKVQTSKPVVSED